MLKSFPSEVADLDSRLSDFAEAQQPVILLILTLEDQFAIPDVFWHAFLGEALDDLGSVTGIFVLAVLLGEIDVVFPEAVVERVDAFVLRFNAILPSKWYSCQF